MDLKELDFRDGVIRHETCNDPVQMEKLAEPWIAQYVHVGKGPFKSEFTQLYGCHMQMNWVNYGSSTHVMGPIPAGCLCFGLPVAMPHPVRFSLQAFKADELLVMSAGQEVDMIVRDHFSMLVVAFELNWIERMLQALLGEPVYRRHRNYRLQLGGQQSGLDLAGGIVHHIMRVMKEPSLLQTAGFSMSLERYASENLLLSVSTELRRENRTHKRQVAKAAREFICNHYDELFSIADLCEALGCTERTLHAGFVEYYNTTPKQYLKRIRYMEARRRLLRIEPHQRIFDVALACGLHHEGRFAREYYRLFGEMPAQTCGRRQHDQQTDSAGSKGLSDA
ncbi:AraC family transcriptional regulator [Ketobacter sp.]|uniref:AraC family transcriptional regulator n=1 Tax=Ketobacter sp. TaxID=2083498 RepID=UPI0025BD2557|nr:AraC family transcriptional regulator [Ketobacter sp.]